MYAEVTPILLNRTSSRNTCINVHRPARSHRAGHRHAGYRLAGHHRGEHLCAGSCHTKLRRIGHRHPRLCRAGSCHRRAGYRHVGYRRIGHRCAEHHRAGHHLVRHYRVGHLRAEHRHVVYCHAGHHHAGLWYHAPPRFSYILLLALCTFPVLILMHSTFPVPPFTLADFSMCHLSVRLHSLSCTPLNPPQSSHTLLS